MISQLLFIGTTELLLIGGMALLLFGGKKLPEMMRGQGVREFKKGVNEVEDDIKGDTDEQTEKDTKSENMQQETDTTVNSLNNASK